MGLHFDKRLYSGVYKNVGHISNTNIPLSYFFFFFLHLLLFLLPLSIFFKCRIFVSLSREWKSENIDSSDNHNISLFSDLLRKVNIFQRKTSFELKINDNIWNGNVNRIETGLRMCVCALSNIVNTLIYEWLLLHIYSCSSSFCLHE